MMRAVDALAVAAWLWVLIDNFRLARRQRAARAALGPAVVGGRPIPVGARVLLVAVLLGGAVALEALTGGRVRVPNAVTAAGLVLLAAGLTLHVVARRRLGVHGASDVTVLAGHELVADGPYAVVRHPLYLAVSAMALGTVLIHPSAATICLAVGLAGGMVLKIAAEERALRSALGARHAAYAARVPAFLPRPRTAWTALRAGLSPRARG
jgi:protein-S-isoprenylcysteine O-methyltransferase Ste14